MEEAAELGNYLPLSYRSPKEQEYIAFLWDAFETNHTYGKYQDVDTLIFNWNGVCPRLPGNV